MRVFIKIILICFCLFIYIMPSEVRAYNTNKYSYSEYPLIRNNIKLHLDCMKEIGKNPNKNILLIHGVTYSSHEFDIDYEDYSLVRALARAGYSVWRLDIAGFGRSEAVKDGFMPNSDYAAEDINAAVEKILSITGQDRIDLFGWSWGTVTTSRFIAKHPDKINKLILYAPILCGIGKSVVTEGFHHNTWEHALEDFQRDNNGKIDYNITDRKFTELWASNCWHYDGDVSPNGGRQDICVESSKILIDLSLIKTPTLVIYGDKDPYLNYKLLGSAQTLLPKGSVVKIIKGGSHDVFVEKPYHKDFQKILIRFLK